MLGIAILIIISPFIYSVRAFLSFSLNETRAFVP